MEWKVIRNSGTVIAAGSTLQKAVGGKPVPRAIIDPRRGPSTSAEIE